MLQQIVNWSREKNRATRNMGVPNKGSAVAIWTIDLLLAMWCLILLIYGKLGYLPSPLLTTSLVISAIFIIVITFFGFLSIE